MQAKENIRTFIECRLPHEYEKCLVGIKQVLKIAWNTTSEPDIERREKIQALSLVKECYTTTLDLLTNASILNDAMKFVSSHQQKHKDKQDRDNKRRISTEEDKSDTSDDDNNNGNGHVEEDQNIEIESKDTNEIF